MVDFVKFDVLEEDVPLNLRVNPLLTFTRPIDPTTGELKEGSTMLEANYQNMRFRLYDSGRLQVSGSVHKYANLGVHNYDLFGYARLLKVLKEFKDNFGFDLKKCNLSNIEFGFNLIPPIDATPLVDGLMLHRSAPFLKFSIPDACYRQAAYDNHFVKAYDKYIQYVGKIGCNVLTQIFRFELKFTEMRSMNRVRKAKTVKIGIKTLADLKDKSKLRAGLELVKEAWEDVKLFDPTLRKNELTSHQKNKKVLQWSNVNWWVELSSSMKSQEKIKMEKAFKDHSENVKEQIAVLMENMVNELLEVDTEAKEVSKKHFAKDLRRVINDEFCAPDEGVFVNRFTKDLRRTSEKAFTKDLRSSYIVRKPLFDTSLICRHFSLTELVDLKPEKRPRIERKNRGFITRQFLDSLGHYPNTQNQNVA